MAQFENITWEEYVLSVGAERARFDTVEYEDGTRRQMGRPAGLLNDLRREEVLSANWARRH